MSFFRRTKICFDAKMNVNLPALKPNTAARGEIGWFLNFRQSEKRAIEEPCLGLSIWRHGQLNVIKAVECHKRLPRTLPVTCRAWTVALPHVRCSRSAW